VISDTHIKIINIEPETAKNPLQLCNPAFFQGGFKKPLRNADKSINIRFNLGTLGDSRLCNETQGGLWSVSMVGGVNNNFKYCVPI
jgi:hypothetical protein